MQFQDDAQIVPDLHATTDPLERNATMTKLLSSLILAAVAMVGFNAQAASHAGAAPMAASGAMMAKPGAAAEPAKMGASHPKKAAKKAKKMKKAASAA